MQSKKNHKYYNSLFLNNDSPFMKEFMFRNNISVKELASDLDISSSYLYQLIRGERKPSRALAQKIESFTTGQVTVGMLLGLQEDRKNHRDSSSLMGAQSKEELQALLSKIQDKVKEIETRLAKLEENCKS